MHHLRGASCISAIDVISSSHHLLSSGIQAPYKVFYVSLVRGFLLAWSDMEKVEKL